MLVVIIYLIFSFILENFMSNVFPSTLSSISAFTTIYTIISLVIIYPHFNNKKKYFATLVTFGLLFDIIYTGTFFLNTFIFIIIGILISFLNNFLPENIFGVNIISTSSIIIYHSLSFIILNIVHYSNYSISLLLSIIVHSLIMTIIYTTLSYLLIETIYRKFNIRDIK